jgi:hypothetical protein
MIQTTGLTRFAQEVLRNSGCGFAAVPGAALPPEVRRGYALANV